MTYLFTQKNAYDSIDEYTQMFMTNDSLENVYEINNWFNSKDGSSWKLIKSNVGLHQTEKRIEGNWQNDNGMTVRNFENIY